MHAIAVDDKALPLRTLTKAIRAVEPDVELAEFRTAESALEYEHLNDVDVAFLDIDMPGMGGVKLAQELKLKNPRINIIFATGFSEYVSQAMSMHASGYLLKPITPKKVKVELDDLRYPLKQDKPRGVFCHCGLDISFDGTESGFAQIGYKRSAPRTHFHQTARLEVAIHFVHGMVMHVELGSQLAHGGQLISLFVDTGHNAEGKTLPQLHPYGNVALLIDGVVIERVHCRPFLVVVDSYSIISLGNNQRRRLV